MDLFIILSSMKLVSEENDFLCTCVLKVLHEVTNYFSYILESVPPFLQTEIA